MQTQRIIARHEEEKMRELDALKYDNKLLKEQVAYLKERIDPFKLDIRDHFAGLAMQIAVTIQSQVLKHYQLDIETLAKC